MAEIGRNITQARQFLESGKLVAIPTETVYGLAGNALDENSILDIFKVKNRPKFDPLISHTDDLGKVINLVSHIPDIALDLAKEFWPGPLTMLLPKKNHVPDLLTSGLDRMAIRIPNHPLTRELLSELEFPLAAPSANPFGYVSPTSAQHVQDQLGDSIPYILDGGSCDIGIESTIIGFDSDERPIVYRLGGMKLEDIERITGRLTIELNKSSNPVAPGQLKTHYAPKKKLFIGDLEFLAKANQNRNVGVIAFNKKLNNLAPDNQIVLSKTGDLDEAAKGLFSALRIMDQKNVDLIITEKFPEFGLGIAINDRLQRAAVRMQE